MKTILHVIDTTGPGGAETVFIDLATRLPPEKYRAVVVIRGKGWVYEELCRRGVSPIFLPASGSFNFKYLWGIITQIRRDKIDLIQSHLLGAGLYCSIAGLMTRTPLVATLHGAVDIGEKERLKRLKMIAVNAGTSRIVAVSDELRSDILRRTNLPEKKLSVVYNGIDTSAFLAQQSGALRNRFGWHGGEVVIGSLGNIRPAKAYDVLLQVASELIRRDKRYRFVIAGQPDKGGLYESLLATREQLDLQDYVKFLGFVDNPGEILSSIDIFLSTSRSEGLPLAAIQAMAAGLPLIATRCGGYAELVTDHENGRLIEVGNVDALSSTIQDLTRNPRLAENLGRAARQHVQQTFDSRIMLEKYQQIYESIL